MATVLITGTSKGIGLETALAFGRAGHKVYATMRKPAQSPELAETAKREKLPIEISAMDVDADQSVREGIAAIQKKAPIDVLVNNAGVEKTGAVEELPLAEFKAAMETNYFGAIRCIQAVLPQMRERRAGVIVNVSSSTTLRSLPLLSVYTATKAAVNAFTMSLALELEPFGIRTRLVLPGRAPGTSFASNARTRMGGGFPDAYAELAQRLMAGMQGDSTVTHSPDVAEAVWRAATDPSCPMRLPAGADAIAWAEAH